MPNTARPLKRTPVRQPRRLRPASSPAQHAMPRPFVKWVGGKGQLLERLLQRIPSDFGAYHEPFVGGGALFFGLWRQRRLQRRPAYLADINAELIDTYRALRDEVEDVMEALTVHHYDQEYYYDVRALDPWTMSRPERAARMIFLNRCGFNGLYRVNQRGKFNVPFGRYSNPNICDRENLTAVSRALDGVTLLNSPFSSVIDRAQPEDVVYFDPPYVPLSRTSNFVSNANRGFGEREQDTLAKTFETLVERGVYVVLSNSDTPWVRDRYEAFDLDRFPARRNINCNASRRGPVGEVLVVGGLS